DRYTGFERTMLPQIRGHGVGALFREPPVVFVAADRIGVSVDAESTYRIQLNQASDDVEVISRRRFEISLIEIKERVAVEPDNRRVDVFDDFHAFQILHRR